MATMSGERNRRSELRQQQLSQWAHQVESWAKELKAVYFYFDNDQAGYAATNALQLREMIFGQSLQHVG